MQQVGQKALNHLAVTSHTKYIFIRPKAKILHPKTKNSRLFLKYLLNQEMYLTRLCLLLKI